MVANISLPRLALTPGEPAGVGPELAIRLAIHLAGQSQVKPVAAEIAVFADPDLLQQRADQLNLAIKIREYQPGTAAIPGTLDVVPVQTICSVTPGQPDPANASYVLETLNRAGQACLEKEFSALITGPVQKSVINDAGIAFSGHTEFLAKLCNVDKTVMLLSDGDLRVALATTHLPLRDVAAAITTASLRRSLEILHADLQRYFGLVKPRILVLGLNPHAGEGGHLGREEIEIITPVLNELREQGWQLSGPVPADTAFTQTARSRYDAVLAMYHDQGLPVLKAGGFGHTVNITLGLPIIRTSVDHGTALDIAAQGCADPGSLLCAIDTAISMSQAAI
ncbi:MAG: 4-hydroxythreonine-4-phosphate dehydrogenase PdxA [Gammaproteobacteria bacterium]